MTKFRSRNTIFERTVRLASVALSVVNVASQFSQPVSGFMGTATFATAQTALNAQAYNLGKENEELEEFFNEVGTSSVAKATKDLSLLKCALQKSREDYFKMALEFLSDHKDHRVKR